jgi:ankyrin repeat protein
MKILSLHVVLLLSLTIISPYSVCAREKSQLTVFPSVQQNFVTTPLHTMIIMQYANKENKFKKIQKLLDAGVDVNARNEDRRTPLWLATFYGVEPEIIDLLIKHGADVTLPDIFNVIPLRNAVDRDDKMVAQLILDAAADMKPHTVGKMLVFKDDAEQSPLDMSDTPEMDEVLENAELDLQ